QQGRDRDHQDAAIQQWQLVKGLEAIGNNVLVGREIVVGQGFPVGQLQQGQGAGAIGLAQEKAQFRLKVGGAGRVGGNQDCEALVLPTRIGDGQCGGAALQSAPAAAITGAGGKVGLERILQDHRHSRRFGGAFVPGNVFQGTCCCRECVSGSLFPAFSFQLSPAGKRIQ